MQSALPGEKRGKTGRCPGGRCESVKDGNVRRKTRRRGRIGRGLLSLAAVLALLCPVRAASGPYLYGATQFGGQSRVDVRLRNPEDALLALCVYDRASDRIHAVTVQTAKADPERHILTVELDMATESTEYVRAFLLDQETLLPLCIPVLSDYVIPYSDDGEEEPPDTEEDPEEEPPDTEEDPEEESPDTEENPEEEPSGTEEDPEENPGETPDPADRVIYGTPTGKRYHYDPDCGGVNSTPVTWEEVQQRGLTPCSKCVG